MTPRRIVPHRARFAPWQRTARPDTPTGRDPAERRETPLTITVDGEPVTGVEGQTLAGVLLGAGRLSWRRGPSGAPRGVFCGIGVCFDCLVTVDGARDVRACRRRARDGDVVTTQSRDEPAVSSSPPEAAPPEAP